MGSMKFGNMLKAGAIMGAVAVVSFFVAQAVIPDKPKTARESVPEKTLAKSETVAHEHEDIPVVTIGDVPIAPSISPPTAVLTPAPPPAEPQSRRQESSSSILKIEKSAVCASIDNRAPQNISDRFSRDSRVYYFTHITGAKDTAAVLHRWYHEGKLVQSSLLRVNSSNWRTHSRRSLANFDAMLGNWRVEAVEQPSGKILDETRFVVE